MRDEGKSDEEEKRKIGFNFRVNFNLGVVYFNSGWANFLDWVDF